MRVVALVALAVALMSVAACERGLPPTLVVEDVVADLARDGADPARAWTSLDPGEALRADGARDSLVMPPGGTTTWRITVPDDGALRFGVGVEGDGKRDDSRAGARFTVAIDGASAFAREVNPAAARAHRRWFDERIDLTLWKGRTVDVTFAVAAAGSGDVAGAAGWSRVRIVRETAVPRQEASPERPNVVVVLADTLRADAVGPHGGAPSLTPRLDALGAGGLVFTQAVSQSSWTLESVSSLMTGLHSRAHGARGRHDKNAGAEWGVLGDGAVTWAELAAHAGITPAGVSANPLVSRGTNLAQGFETFVELPWNPDGRNWPDGAAVNDAFFDWLGTHGGRRFVAYLHYMEPHDPYTPSDPPDAGPGLRPAIAKGWIRDAATRINWTGAGPLSADEIAHLRARYRREVAAWDAELGALVDRLTSAGLLDRTVVVVTADHGEEFQEHGRLTHGSHLYDETVRVPLVLRGPGIPVGRRDDPVQGIDVFPTLARILGVAPPAGLGGRDLLAAADETRPAVLETSSGIGPDGAPLDLIAVRTARWKLVETPALGRRELYDLTADPAERDDRAASAPEAGELAAALARWRDATRTAAAETVAPGVHERLRALGYTQ